MRTLLIVSLATAAVLFTSACCEARGPHGHCFHRQLPAPHHAGHIYAVPQPTWGGYALPVPKSSYAYGWFGVKPRCHKGVHHGYFNNYTRWSYR